MSDPFYELRLYRCVNGRIGDLHHRMSHDVPPLFRRHGIPDPLAYFAGLSGPRGPLYAYILKWDDLDERLPNFRAFYTDPDWLVHREESNAGVEMVDRIEVVLMRALTPPDLTLSALPEGGLCELRLQDISNSDSAAATSSWTDLHAPVLARHGGRTLGAFSLWFGSGFPRLVTLTGWDDAATRRAGLAAWEADTDVAATFREERARHGRALFDRCETFLLDRLPQPAA